MVIAYVIVLEITMNPTSNAQVSQFFYIFSNTCNIVFIIAAILIGVKWHVAIFEEWQGGPWGQNRMSEEDPVGSREKTREKIGSQILHLGPENHFEDLGCSSG